MIRPFIVGFATTLKHIFKKPITVNYPDEKIPVFPKWRGKQVLMRDENGLEKCVACGLCAVACPADAIYLEAAENDGIVQAGPRYAKIYQIHKTRCIFCGYCEEACPVSAIFMGKDYELAVYSNKDFIWDKDDLLVPALPRRRRSDDAARASAERALRRPRRHPRRLRQRPRASCDGTPRCRSGSASATSPTTQGRYEPLRAPLYWIKGNNENFDAIAAGDLPDSLHYLPNGVADGYRRRPRGRPRRDVRADAGTTRRRPTCRIRGRATAKATELADKRRHFVREEVEACKALRGVDVFLTHEAPRPYFAGRRAAPERRREDRRSTRCSPR